MADPVTLNGALSTATQDYVTTFAQYVHQFIQWGQWLFFSLLTINIALMCLWYAFEKESFVDSTASFIRKFFIIALFYTVMLHHEWLLALLQTTNIMGSTFTHAKIDPSSIISNGLAVVNRILQPVQSFNIFKISFGAFVILAVYLIILIAFISVALELAKTLIITTAKISISTFFLGFAALEATSKIAHHTLESILTNCIKLLGIYMVVAAGNNVISNFANALPSQETSFDDYWWLVSIVLLFWILARSLPDELAKMVSYFYSQSNADTHVAAMGMSATKVARSVASMQDYATAVTGGLAKSGIKTSRGAFSGASSAYTQARTEGLSKPVAAMEGAAGAVSGVKNLLSSVSRHYEQLAMKTRNPSSGDKEDKPGH